MNGVQVCLGGDWGNWLVDSVIAPILTAVWFLCSLEGRQKERQSSDSHSHHNRQSSYREAGAGHGRLPY